MKLGISNLAWDKNIDLSFLKRNNINYIEIILSKYIDWNNINLNELNKFIDNVKMHGIEILSTQSIFYNSNINNFSEVGFVNHIEKVIDVCNNVKISKLILGAPSLRISKINVDLINNLYYIDKILKKHNQILLLEPNSKEYKGNYFHTVKEIVNFILENDFSNIKTMVDTHNVILENQNPSKVFLENMKYIEHIHVSEMNLGDFIESKEHIKLANTLNNNKYEGLIIYESKPSTSILKSIELFSKIYCI